MIDNNREKCPGQMKGDVAAGAKNSGTTYNNPGPTHWFELFLLFAIIVLSAVPLSVSGSTPPQQPLVSVSVANRTVSPGSGIDISVEWAPNAVIYPAPPDTIEISLYSISNSSLLGTYTIQKTGDRGATRQFKGTIPGSVLPTGDVMLVATDPVSGENSRMTVSVLAPGESYPAYRSRQVMEGVFSPVAAGLIIIMVGVLGILIAKRE